MEDEQCQTRFDQEVDHSSPIVSAPARVPRPACDAAPFTWARLLPQWLELAQ
jgi:hypothetical protein